MGIAVPDDDLPSNAVPADDLPDAAPVAKPSRMQTAISDYMRAIPIAGPIGAAFVTAAKHGPAVQADLAYAAGGKATDIASELGASPETAAKFGLAANVGTQMFPPTPFVAGKAVGTAAAPVMEASARRLLQSSIKPDRLARNSGQSEQAITTALEKGLYPTEGGLEVVRKRVGTLETDIQDALSKSPAFADKDAIAKAADKVLQDIKLNPDVIAEAKSVKDAVAAFMSHPALAQYGNKIPVSLVNDMKQAFYKAVGDKKYAPGYQVTAEDKANKALAHGMRGEVADKVPGVVPSLKEQSELLNFLKVAGPQVAREGNKNILGFGALGPKLEGTLVWMLDRYPWFKTYLAHTMHSGASRIPAEIAAGSVIAGETATGRK